MGKGGQKAAQAPGPQVWKSPYDPLSKNAPELPTKGEIKASIPKECFERSYIWHVLYLVRDLTISAAFAYATSQVLSTDIPSEPVELAKYVKMLGIEAGGEGILPEKHAARFQGGSLGVLQGTRSYILQDDHGHGGIGGRDRRAG